MFFLRHQGASVKTPLACAAALLLVAATVNAQHDPGPRPGPAAAGGPFPTLNVTEKAYFTASLAIFNEVDSVSGTLAGEDGKGLGPTFNGNSCAQCHAQPAVGGSSPGLNSPQHPVPNPQVALAKKDHPNPDPFPQTVPSFITANGPVREARFVSADPSNANAALDGGVHGLYTISGRTDAPGCHLAQPNFNQALAAGNVIFRIPTPTFGLGLVENTSDATLRANLAANTNTKASFGIAGKLNTSGNDGTVTRFGWKAQNKSLLIFAGEAYNVEQGVSNEAFPNERSAVPGCVFNKGPEDFTSPAGGNSDVTAFAAFMRLTAPPTPAPATASTSNGQALFNNIGCALCHTPSLTTSDSQFTGMSDVTYHPYSDFAVHNMGSQLTDGVPQGAAGPDEFRTAPLWGLGQRLFFLHDGRTSDLSHAIQFHAGSGNVCVVTQDFAQFSIDGGVTFFQPFSQTQNCGSEANTTVANFNSLSPSNQQDILNFLRSL
jgi:CxxC motif-containing protein (DUF1111 family)